MGPARRGLCALASAEAIGRSSSQRIVDSRPHDDDQVLSEQIEYYRRRAAEYDLTTKPVYDQLWAEEDVIRSALREFSPRGRVLEIACGTGSYTVELVPFASEITAIDASPEMLQHHREKVRSEKVRRVVADAFSWVPDRTYDVVFFANWLSHVPLSHFERFWGLVERCLDPDGRVFFMDERKHEHWREDYLDKNRGIVRRRVVDGSEYRAIKVLWDPRELESKLRDLDWDISVESTGAFYWGKGQRTQ